MSYWFALLLRHLETASSTTSATSVSEAQRWPEEMDLVAGNHVIWFALLLRHLETASSTTLATSVSEAQRWAIWDREQSLLQLTCIGFIARSDGHGWKCPWVAGGLCSGAHGRYLESLFHGCSGKWPHV
jgi:hypothetical protein